MSKSVSESRQRVEMYQTSTISTKHVVITTVVALAALTALVIGLMTIISSNTGIPLNVSEGIACAIAGGLTLIILTALNCIYRRENCSSSASEGSTFHPRSSESQGITSTRNNDFSGGISWVGNIFKKNKNPTKVDCSYCLHKESENGIRQCNFFTKASCLTPQEQEKIDRLLSYFNAKGTDLAQELQVEISSIHFSVTKFPNTDHIKLGVRLEFECNTKDINGFDYVLPTFEFDAADIPDNLPQQIEQRIKQSQTLWKSILKFLKTEVNCSAIFECCRQQALQYQLEVKNFRLDHRLDFTYRADEQKMTLERFNCHYNGEWHDGQIHYQNTRPWDNNYEQWIMFLYLSIDEVNADTIDNLLVKFLSAIENHFKSDFEHLVETTEPPHLSWDDWSKWWAGWGDEPSSSGSIEDIKEALAELQEELTPGSTFTNLEVNEGNLEKIKDAVKSNFKKHALKLHPDKVGPQGEEKFKTVVSLYRKIEANYKALGFSW